MGALRKNDEKKVHEDLVTTSDGWPGGDRPVHRRSRHSRVKQSGTVKRNVATQQCSFSNLPYRVTPFFSPTTPFFSPPNHQRIYDSTCCLHSFHPILLPTLPHPIPPRSIIFLPSYVIWQTLHFFPQSSLHYSKKWTELSQNITFYKKSTNLLIIAAPHKYVLSQVQNGFHCIK